MRYDVLMHTNCINAILLCSSMLWFWASLLPNNSATFCNKMSPYRDRENRFPQGASNPVRSAQGLSFFSWSLFPIMTVIFTNFWESWANRQGKFSVGIRGTSARDTMRCTMCTELVPGVHSVTRCRSCPQVSPQHRASIGESRDPLLSLDSSLCIPLQIHPGRFWDHTARKKE